MLYAYPDATFDSSGQRVWNATDASRGAHGPSVDDSAYLAAVVAEIKSRASVDPKRIYFFGHSNGGFMCYRMACDHADMVAAIVSLAGATFWRPRDCQPVAPVAVLQVPGTADNSVFYGGGAVNDTKYPGAWRTVAMWARYDGCSGDVRRARRRLNLVAEVRERDPLATRGSRCMRMDASPEGTPNSGPSTGPNTYPR
jgi:polyhydroxybutyrate depolymerase